jgi:hypothetical protein
MQEQILPHLPYFQQQCEAHGMDAGVTSMFAEALRCVAISRNWPRKTYVNQLTVCRGLLSYARIKGLPVSYACWIPNNYKDVAASPLLTVTPRKPADDTLIEASFRKIVYLLHEDYAQGRLTLEQFHDLRKIIKLRPRVGQVSEIVQVPDFPALLHKFCYRHFRRRMGYKQFVVLLHTGQYRSSTARELLHQYNKTFKGRPSVVSVEGKLLRIKKKKRLSIIKAPTYV